MPLDRRRDYGFVVGAHDGRAFEQDGRWFTAAGDDWDSVPYPEPYDEVAEAKAAQIRRASNEASELTRSVTQLKRR